MNKKFFSFIVSVALFAAVLTSCEKKEVDPKLTPSEVQKDAIIAELSKNNNLTEFVELLKTLDVADINAEKLTIFAVSNAGMSKSALKSTADDGVVLKRHIVEGQYSQSMLTDSLQITALDGTVLLITIIEGVYYVNGIEIGTEIPADNSIAYIVDMALRAKPVQRYDFNVYECNPAWSPDNDVPYLLVSEAVISIRDELGAELGQFTTDEGGIFNITLERGTYFYKVTKGNASNISKDGFLIAGIITCEFVVDTIPNAIPSVLGGLFFADLNGDGIINDADKPVNGYTRLQPNQTVYIAPADFAPTYRPEPKSVAVRISRKWRTI
jgi:uncharacterized surface protein with fasciclin (FAS1) repeats